MRRRGPIAHTGGGGMGVGQYTAREPHLADRKLYVLCDITHRYVLDVYLSMGHHGHLPRYGSCSGGVDTKGIVHFWGRGTPDTLVLRCDSFFGTNNIGQELAGQV